MPKSGGSHRPGASAQDAGERAAIAALFFDQRFDFQGRSNRMWKMSASTFKASLAGFVLSALVAGALFMPVTIASEILLRIPPAAQHYCPDSGMMAERYFSRAGGPPSPQDYVICLDKAGERVSDRAAYDHLVREVWLAWTLILFPLAFLILKAQRGNRATRLIRRRSRVR
jgi:hypothetical protein